MAEAFRLALDLAAEQEGATAPNPAVGCVLLDAQGQVLTAAAHQGAGQPHAEARAIQMAREAGLTPRIHTVVVTLEPCNHQGRTGPCSAAILTTPAREVWYAVADPNPTASGGAETLAQAGLAVGDLSQLDHPNREALQTRATRLLAPFATRILRGRPFVTVKQALDPQGSMIPPPGQKTFTGPEALTLAHRLRRRADAILTGSGTVLADAPEFTVRHVPDIKAKSRWLCILDRRGRVGEAYLEAARQRGFRPFLARDLNQALHDLAARGCNEVLVEAGPLVTETIRQSGLWDEWVLIRKGPPDTITTTLRQD
ncbi:bifunctional diaminohydroxyphosphoribosylaminopyrimidine deaminase/5-amino-6-(5-phosphoribosylamino)uracil reductase RibD [Rhodobacteraceae bacterium CYK-10]|uniref:Riboflavin biosynthesis protein RibD n=1 Tax=Stagnihabitans tardus TaxID=2699202 RepID=A0AAE5BX55_9RHOB|nr:bifunctional diaminohydroxyphosphoribosylaminopyrimidine deaminase/5-amino-6-(5-phosphoribosylamino)uracil reductase RibD [Stagnihabitans tardus]